jgi:hypothetical protein
MFGFPSAHKSYIYTKLKSIKCEIVLCPYLFVCWRWGSHYIAQTELELNM